MALAQNLTALIEGTLESTRKLLGNVRQNLVKVAANLVFLRENETRPWAEVLEDLDISQGFASKLCTSYTHYVIEGGLDPQKLEGVDMEKLYLSAKTEGGVEEQFARAATLTRGELRIERQENDPCLHENKGFCCYDCWTKLDN